MKVGCCGWQRYPERGDRLKNYARVFDVVEVNSTFYRLPRVKTAEGWLKKAREVNENFEFTVKMPREITHKDRFASRLSLEFFEKAKEVAKALQARILLFQTPASFKPTEENITRVEKFFEEIDREDFLLAWEVRWERDWKREIVAPLFKRLEIEHVVDPLRQESFHQTFGYYRLHGFGKRMMYDYKFSEEELKKVAKRCGKGSYVFFNNYYMYEDAKRFAEMVGVKKI